VRLRGRSRSRTAGSPRGRIWRLWVPCRWRISTSSERICTLLLPLRIGA